MNDNENEVMNNGEGSINVDNLDMNTKEGKIVETFGGMNNENNSGSNTANNMSENNTANTENVVNNMNENSSSNNNVVENNTANTENVVNNMNENSGSNVVNNMNENSGSNNNVVENNMSGNNENSGSNVVNNMSENSGNNNVIENTENSGSNTVNNMSDNSNNNTVENASNDTVIDNIVNMASTNNKSMGKNIRNKKLAKMAMNEAQNEQLEKENFYEEKFKKPAKRRGEWAKLIASTMIVSVVGGGSIGVGYGLVKSTTIATPEPTITNLPIVARPVSTTTDNFSSVDVIKAVKPTVVSISTQTSLEKQYFGTFSVPYETEGAGSGVIFYSDDDRVAIATNNHVVDEATSIFVTFGDGEDEYSVPAKIAGTKSEADLAVITVNWEDLEEQGIYSVNVATFGNSDSLEVGDPVFAIGNAMGMGISATDGIISMTEQKIYIEESELVVLQTSAAINSGNSGGALVNSAGEVIGINTAKYNSSKTEGMGYAIPSNEIIPIIEQLLLNGTQPQPFVGITGTSITADNAALYRLPVGALVMEVTEDAPAFNAGIQVGDIITQFDGKTIMDMEALIGVINETEVGKEVDVHVIRNGEESVDLSLVIGDKNL